MGFLLGGASEGICQICCLIPSRKKKILTLSFKEFQLAYKLLFKNIKVLPKGGGDMVKLKFDKNICYSCETIDCLVKCQYLRFNIATAKKEKLKILKGEDTFILTECVTCYACEEYCLKGNHPFFQIVELQEEKGLYTAPKPITHQQIKMTSPKGRFEIKHPLINPVISLCVYGDMMKKIGESFCKEVSFLLGRDFFCNLVFLHFAKMSIIKERLPKIIEMISNLLKKNNLDDLICFHDECYAGLTYLAPAYGIPVPFKPIHLFEFLTKRLNVLKNNIKPLNQKVAYQRPCSNRLIPETQCWEDKIFNLIGVERIQRKYDRSFSLCCGSTFRMMGRDDLADEVQEKNVADMVNSKVKYCVFNCPMCYYTLGEKVNKEGIIPVMMVDLCQYALESGKS